MEVLSLAEQVGRPVATCGSIYRRRYLRYWPTTQLVVADRQRVFLGYPDLFRCARCGRMYTLRDLEYDHIVEIADGGKLLEPSNVQLLCVPCHRVKTSESAARRRLPTPSRTT
jgi:5-methylcytosine-specific restriction endonuclease McrA